jgi:hypothetical protein
VASGQRIGSAEEIAALPPDICACSDTSDIVSRRADPFLCHFLRRKKFSKKSSSLLS